MSTSLSRANTHIGLLRLLFTFTDLLKMRVVDLVRFDSNCGYEDQKTGAY